MDILFLFYFFFFIITLEIPIVSKLFQWKNEPQEGLKD